MGVWEGVGGKSKMGGISSDIPKIEDLEYRK
jgi:hypothetical protein